MAREIMLSAYEIKLAALIVKMYADLNKKQLDVAVINVLQEAGIDGINGYMLDQVYEQAQKLSK